MKANQRAKLAEKYGASLRTVQRWEAEGAPFDRPKAMLDWLASRKNIPGRTRQLLSERTKAAAAKSATHAEQDMDPATIGAPQSLRRLEREEARSHREYREALRSGEAIRIKLARKAWLDVGDSLRKFDILVAANRRDSGELVPRADVEKAVQSLITWTKLAILSGTNAIAPDLAAAQTPHEVHELIRCNFLEQLVNSISIHAAAPTKSRVPDWMLAAAVRPMEGSFSEAKEAVLERARFLCERTALAYAEQEPTPPKNHTNPN